MYYNQHFKMRSSYNAHLASHSVAQWPGPISLLIQYAIHRSQSDLMKTKVCLFALALLVGACQAAPAQPAQIDPPFPAPGTLPATGHRYPVETGWFNGQAVQYYNFGANTPLNPQDPTRVLVKNVWQFNMGQNADGTPVPLDGQNNLFDATVGDADYSDLWLLHFVTPPANYVPDTITSAEALLAGNFEIEKRPLDVNCPVVPEGATLQEDDRPLKVAWVRGRPVSYFDFGGTSPTPGKLYALVTGFAPDGSPQLVPGQHFIFSSAHSERGYSDFWVVQWVLVDQSYAADSLRSASDIHFEVKPSTLVVDYPQK